MFMYSIEVEKNDQPLQSCYDYHLLGKAYFIMFFGFLQM